METTETKLSQQARAVIDWVDSAQAAWSLILDADSSAIVTKKNVPLEVLKELCDHYECSKIHEPREITPVYWIMIPQAVNGLSVCVESEAYTLKVIAEKV